MLDGAPLGDERALKDHLLRLTLERAAQHSPYWRRVLGSRWRKVRGLRELHLLPFLTKDEAISHQDELLTVRDAVFSGVISSGSTHGDKRPLRVPRTEAEIAAIHDYEHLTVNPERSGREASAESKGAAGRRPERASTPARRASAQRERSQPAARDDGLLLEVRSMQHGLPEFGAPPGVLRVPWTFTANGLRLIEELLTRPQPGGRRVTALIIGASPLMVLTAHLLDKGFDFGTLAVDEIGTTGFRLSTKWREAVQSAWGARVFDNFSLSEFATPALECHACGYNHWLSPPLVCEVVDPFTKAPLTKGTGVLVLTSLYPFAQAMPLIRYFTADLVRLGPKCPQSSSPGILFRGRLAQTVIQKGIEGEPVVLSPADVVEYLERRPEVARLPHPCLTLGLTRSPDTGTVKYQLVPPLRVRVELRFDPKVFPDEAAGVATGLGRHLLSASRRLRKLEADREVELEIELVGPGTLESKWTKY